ncbi:MAG: M23 family metallopeptidase [Dehalococcoidia bacterium]|nr:MAG: M23 family metallopeptidase [Dehalococcoidia bacterium]
MNLYSLYGHLSPSRWYIESDETVEKDQLIGHLGDSDENGGSVENPLYPYLHFGIRVGQRVDYSSIGEWRWQAGWIKYCPHDLGWHQPSLVIVNQEVPPGGFQKPQTGFFEVWWLEFILSVVIFTGAVVSFVMLTRRG